MHKTLEDFSIEVANDVGGEPAEAGGQIIQMIMQLIMSLLGSCPTATDKAIAAKIKSPTIRDKARVRMAASEAAGYSFLGRFRQRSWAISEALITRGRELPDEDAISIIQDARNPDWFVL